VTPCRAWQVMVERALDRVTDAYLVNCEAIAAWQVERKRLPREKIEVIPNGIDLGRLPPFSLDRRRARLAAGLQRDRRLVAAVGRLDAQKDFPTFLRAAAMIAAELPDIDFLVVGEGEARAAPRARGRGRGDGAGAARPRARTPPRDRRAPARGGRLLGRRDGRADDGRLPAPAPRDAGPCDRRRRVSGPAGMPREAARRPLRPCARAAHPLACAPAALPALRAIAALRTLLPHARALCGLRAPLRARAGVLRRRHLHQLRRDGRGRGERRARARLDRRADARPAARDRGGARRAGPARVLPLCPEPVARDELPRGDGR